MPAPSPNWHALGSVGDLRRLPLQQCTVGRARIALSYANGDFAAISGACNHVGGPLGDGRLDGEYVVCPWHYWRYHRATGQGEPGYEAEAVPAYPVKVEDGKVWVDLASATERTKIPHEAHPLARTVERAAGPTRVVGISTTVMGKDEARVSTSETLLKVALQHAEQALGCESQLIRLRDLGFRHCEGFYSKSAQACTWPCSITQMDSTDQMDQVYEALVHWADVLVLATPIRWGVASSLYFKMAERLNCVQNQITIRNRTLIRNKAAAFIITGGQDNIQGVAGQLLTFFGEIGFMSPQFPFIAHSRGWTAEDMEANVAQVLGSEELHQGSRELVERAVQMARWLVEEDACPEQVSRGGRKAHRLEVEREARARTPSA